MTGVKPPFAPVKPEDFAPLLRDPPAPMTSTRPGPARCARTDWVGISPKGSSEPVHRRDKERYL